MPMHTSLSIDTDLGRAETMLPRMGPITTSLSPNTQTDILRILQREQDCAIALLSSSPLLTSLFVSYANQAAALESTSATPSPESEEWKGLQNAIVTLREGIKKLESENLKVTEGLDAAEASREAFHSQVSSLKEVNTTQENDIKSLRAELAKAKEKYDRLMVDSNAEKAALQIRVLDLEAQRGELKEAIVEQQIKISKVGRQGTSNFPNFSISASPPKAAYAPELNTPKGLNAIESEPSVPGTVGRKKATKQHGEEWGKKEAQENKEREELDRVVREEREVREKRDARMEKEREEREERERKEQEERAEKKVIEREEMEAQARATPPGLTPEFVSETLSRTTSELLKTAKDVKEDVPTTPNPRSTPSLTPVSAPANIEPEKPLSLWERGELKATIQPAPASNSFDGGGNAESIAIPTIVRDRQSIFTDPARDQKRENQRENLVEGFLGSNPARRRNDSAQSQMTVKPVTKPAPAPAPLPQRPSGWGSWGSSLINNITSAVATERSPSPEPPLVKPKIEDPPRGFVPSQPAGFGSMNKLAWGAGGAGDNNTCGAAKTGPTPMTQKPSAGPAWDAKPMGSTFDSGGTTWGSGTGPTSGPSAGRNPAVNTVTKPPGGGLITVGPENIPESAVEVKHVPAPGGFNGSIMDKKEETSDAQDDVWGWEETKANGSKKNSKDLSPIEKAPETQAEEIREPTKTEETATPVEEDEFDWAPLTKKKKKGQAASVAQTPYFPNTPDPDNVDDGAGGWGGGGGGKKKKKKAGRG